MHIIMYACQEKSDGKSEFEVTMYNPLNFYFTFPVTCVYISILFYRGLGGFQGIGCGRKLLQDLALACQVSFEVHQC